MATDPATSRRIAVLGGAGGIGRALVASLLARGDTVTVLDLKQSLERHEPETTSIKIDVLSESAIEEAMKGLRDRAGTLDGFVNLVGYNSVLQPITETTAAYFDDIVAGNLRGAFLSTKAALPLMDTSNYRRFPGPVYRSAARSGLMCRRWAWPGSFG